MTGPPLPTLIVDPLPTMEMPVDPTLPGKKSLSSAF